MIVDHSICIILVRKNNLSSFVLKNGS